MGPWDPRRRLLSGRETLGARATQEAERPYREACDPTLYRTPVPAPRDAATGPDEAGSDAADACFWTRAESRRRESLLRAAGRSQVRRAIETVGSDAPGD